MIAKSGTIVLKSMFNELKPTYRARSEMFIHDMLWFWNKASNLFIKHYLSGDYDTSDYDGSLVEGSLSPLGSVHSGSAGHSVSPSATLVITKTVFTTVLPNPIMVSPTREELLKQKIEEKNKNV
jgi:hypothetical protein